MSIFCSKTMVKVILCLCVLRSKSNAAKVKYLRTNNFTDVLTGQKLALVNFYADWCHFCHELKPILEQTAELADQHPNGRHVVFAQVNCDVEPGIRKFFHITKYPTLKVIRNGMATPREYRKQRTTQALLDFVLEELEDPVQDMRMRSTAELKDKVAVSGVFSGRSSPQYDLFSRVCATFNHFGVCQCFAQFFEHELNSGKQPSLSFESEDKVEQFEDKFEWATLVQWFTQKCIPLVRAITFDNAEEISEEGKPLLILCHRHDDRASVAKFKKLIVDNLVSAQLPVSFVTADDLFYQKIFHQRLHLSAEDLPVLRLDDFTHVYRLPSLQQLAENKPSIRTVLDDFFSGKLHSDYHDGNANHCDKDTSPDRDVPVLDIYPIFERDAQSIFRNLTPSSLRYSLLSKEEL